MQYLALIYGDEARWGSLSPEERGSARWASTWPLAKRT